jgi:transposase
MTGREMRNDWSEEALDAFNALGIAPKTLPHFVKRAEPTDEPVPPERNYSELTDEEAEVILPLLPAESRQSGSISNRVVIDALLWVRKSGRKLTHLPARFGATPEAVRKRRERWCLAGALDRLLDRLETLQLSDARRGQLRAICIEQAKRGERIRRERGQRQGS